ncbi:ribitol-5-phosphate xylosyltransferase 1-like [Corticium candelabrum]|uniref:ribitol-5-phosphate xylosyltransferase 1-like n=1 Tax=Corticium candelabrum TaxID=121492 RepID=UPI002E305C20|nr:ribitol-5-phosphate xylosyltransferase 1-like [Corticium candelabrum]
MLRLKLLLVCASGIYLLFTFYATYTLYGSWKADVDENTDDYSSLHHVGILRPLFDKTTQMNRFSVQRTIDIWSLTNAGSYLWQEILQGEVITTTDKLHIQGSTRIFRYLFQYHAGKGISPDHVVLNRDFVVLSLNGRSDETISQTMTWLDVLQQRQRRAKLLLLLIGRENCNNDWVRPYLKRNGGIVEKLFIVYDTALIDEVDVYQWPLGSALYRGFSGVSYPMLHLDTQRPYSCNFVGTVHPGSSRERLAEIIEEHGLGNICYVNTRSSWPSHEQSSSVSKYRGALLQSDLTLCPAGINTECYRIYEACELGSVPVVEDNVVDTSCDVPANPLSLRNVTGNSTSDFSAPLRLLKRYNAPFIFVKSWDELPAIMRHELRLFLPDIIERRKRLVKWYEYFKQEIRKHFLDVLEQID